VEQQKEGGLEEAPCIAVVMASEVHFFGIVNVSVEHGSG